VKVGGVRHSDRTVESHATGFGPQRLRPQRKKFI
jgi:hypothetical protein